MTITEAFELYRIEFIAYNNQSPKTEEGSIGAMNVLVRYFGDVEISTLTAPMVRRFKTAMEQRNRAPNTIRGYIIKLRVVLRWLRAGGYECVNPDLILAPKRAQGSIDFVTPDEVLRLIKACENPMATRMNRLRNKAIVATLFSTGLRVSELCRMDIAHTRGDYFSIKTKGGNYEVFYIDNLARKYITEYLARRRDGCPALFITDQLKKRMTPNMTQEVFRTLSKNTGLRVKPHVMRHSFATDLMRNGADIRKVQAMMHHKSIQTTEQYLHVLDNELEDIHTAYHTKLI